MRSVALAGATVVVLASCSGGGGSTNAGPSPLETLTVAASEEAPFAAPSSVAPAPPAASPTAAVEAYLAAEVARDYDASFALLATAERERMVSAPAWRASKSRSPRLTGFTSVAAEPDGSVTTEVTLQPAVDTILGVVPASARITWVPVAEDGGWRVALQGSTFEARYPSDAGVAPAALAWVSERQACTPSPADERLVFEPELPQALCGVAGTFTVAQTGPLTDLLNPSPVLASYGPDAVTWARVASLAGPTDLDLVLAPLGSTWVVIGATSS